MENITNKNMKKVLKKVLLFLKLNHIIYKRVKQKMLTWIYIKLLKLTQKIN